MNQTHILVVEDESIVALDLRQRLEGLGYAVMGVVMTGEKAIAGAREKRPDLVMMDIGLAGTIDGIEAAEEIRRSLQIPVVYVTAYSDNATLQRAKVTEPFGYVLKPFDERELRTTIEMALYKHALDARLKESEGRYRSLVETSTDGISLTDPGGTILFCNNRMVQMHGFREAGKMVGKNLLDLFAPEERARGHAELEQLLQRGKVANAEHIMLRKDGTCFPAELSASVIVEGEGRKSAMMCITRDISGRKLAERKLRESEELFRVIAEVSPVGILRTDAEGRIIYANERACQISDLELDEIQGSGWVSAVHQDDRARILQEWQGAVARHVPLRAEYRVMSKAGRITWVLFQADVEYDAAGSVAGYVGTLTDITERKEVEEELRSKNAFLRDILESSSAISIMSTDLQGGILFWNTGAENMLGYKAEEIVCGGTVDILYPDDEPQTIHAVKEMRDYVLEKKLSIRREIKEIRKDGRKLWVNITVSPRFDEQGNVAGMLGIGEDITERKFAEHATKQAERELRLLAFTLNCAKDSFCITDLENSILFVNQSFLDTYGYSEEELLGQNIEVLRSGSVPPGLAEQIRAKTRDGGWSGEIMNRRKDGTDFPIELWTSVVRNDAGDPVALVGVARDITERKRAEERIQDSLREKEVLLKEIHHRVKNNLQVIASLLNLQASTIKDDRTLTVFKESQNRVKSMSLVHQELYQSEDLARIDFAEYIRKLTANLFLSYGVDSLDIELKRSVSDVYLTVDTAIPCGLIINELVSNSLKYAFPNGKKGEIGVCFHRTDERYTLTVSDNGVGFPTTLDFRKTESLGLQLVNTLTRQLRGSIELDTSNGTAFTLIFGRKEKRE